MSNKKKVEFRAVFDSSWVLSHRMDKELPPAWLAGVLRRLYPEADLFTYVAALEGTLLVDADAREASIENHMTTLFREQYPTADASVFSVSVNAYHDTPSQKPEQPEQPEQPEKTDDEGEVVNIDDDFIMMVEPDDAPPKRPRRPKFPKKEAAPEEPKKLTVLEEINQLTGAAEFKKIAAESASVAPYLIKNNLTEAFTNRCYLLSVNDGDGLTNCLGLFAELTKELGLFQLTSGTVKAVEVVLAPPGDENGLDGAFKVFKEYGPQGFLVCYDLSEWMSKFRDKVFRDFLRKLQGYVGKNLIFFRVPFVEKHILHDLKESLSDVLSVTDFSIAPFSMPELDEIAKEMISAKGFTMEADAWELFHERITEEKNDGRFYGINTVRKVVLEMLYLKQLHAAETGEDNTVLGQEELLPLVAQMPGKESSGFEELDALVGMEDIRRQIEEILAQIVTLRQNSSLGFPCIHMRFTGNPGTGKTTIARILGKILKEKGVLRKGGFFEYFSRDLCGRYIGETAPKTAAICRDAYGSVLFIDEAYALYRSDSSRDYGREAIDTLITEMENHRSDLIVIMAGYTDDMERLMDANAGLKSRMPYEIKFPNYSREQLADIFMRLAGKSFTYDEDFEETVRKFFRELPDEIYSSKEFSNARYARNLYERTWAKAALRCQLSGIECVSLTAEDFVQASSEKDFQALMEKKRRPIGFAI